MKTLVIIVLAVVLVALAMPLFKYRTIEPCAILKKERIEQIQEGLEEAGEEVAEVAAEHGKRAEQIVDDVREALGGLADGLAEQVVEHEVGEMSLRECVAELWKMRKND